jgi:AraC-like DNA-binding protein
MSFGWFDLILIIGVAQGFFLALLLFRKAGNLKANRILAILVFAYSLFILNALFVRSAFFEKYPHVAVALGELPLLFGPLHYFYAKFLIYKQAKFSFKEWLQLFPFLISKIYTAQAFLMSAQQLFSFIKNLQKVGDPVLNVLGWVIAVQGLTYMIMTLGLIRKYTERIKENYSTIDEINLNWLKNITFMALAVWIVVFVEEVLRVFHSNLLGENSQLIAMLTAVFIYALGYMGLSKSEIFLQKIVTEWKAEGEGEKTDLKSDDQSVADRGSRKYQKSGLSVDKAKRIVDSLLQLMKRERPYTDSDLTLTRLAESLKISPHNLSEAINTQLGQTFFDFINQHRVEQVKRDLSDPHKQHFTFLALGLEAGFNSKSSFNAIFKKNCGMTPSEYRRMIEDSAA